MMRISFGLIPVLAAQLAFGMIASAGDEFFVDNVAPIFQQHCLRCHNHETQKGGFSIQSAAGLADVIETGDAAASHLIDLVTPTDGKAKMPKESEPLSAADRETLTRWIRQGAKWPVDFELSKKAVTDFQWWSYQPIRNPKPPAIDNDWIKTPIDAFVLHRLNDHALTPSPPADRRALIRRVTYDLTGLPPTSQAVDAFVADRSDDAYQKLVDQLLDSQQYGERWARHWLDVVKYADTCGYDKDKLRHNAWPYRDYVIRSLNNDKRYDRFVQEQIAGDALFPGTPDGILGLGFIAAGPWDFIGHVEVPESKIDGKVARNLDRDDMVNNVLNTFCSLTVQCARCHNHKFDPITQQHYYALQNVFAAVDRAERPYDLDPKVIQKKQQLEAQIASAKQRLQKIKAEINAAAGPRLAKVRKQIAKLKPKIKSNRPPEYGYHSQIEPKQNVTKWVEVDLGAETLINRVVLRACEDDYNGIGAGFGFPIRFEVQVSMDGKDWIAIADHTQKDFPNPGIAPVAFDDLELSCQLIRVTAIKLAERQNDYIFALSELQAFGSGDNVCQGKVVRSLDSIQAPTRWARKNLVDGKWPSSSDLVLAKQLAKLQKEQAALVVKGETPARIKLRKAAAKQIDTATRALKKLPAGKMVYAAATTFTPQGNFKPTNGKLRPVHVLHRGDVQSPMRPAPVGTIPLPGSDGIFDSSPDEKQRRAELARWLTDRQHPLVWRSIVNRVWQHHFGQGIVATPNDFGRMGALPTHPELLDWLATKFRDGDQSFKNLHRLIVTSNVYQQSSANRDSAASIDGDNQFLWRMNRRRLSAEEIRDSILFVSDQLNSKMGGPGYYLFDLQRTTHSPHYEYHKFDPADPKSHRRSIYRFIVRSQPDPWMTTLDCADSSQSTPRRTETLTSLQALSLLNSKFNLVMAKKFAASLKAKGDLEQQVHDAVRTLLQRQPTADELQNMVQYAKQHEMVNLCRMLFNLSEFVYVD